MKYGLIGGGMMGQEHIRNIQLLGQGAVVAVADPDEAMRHASAELAGAKAYGDHQAMLASDPLDALILASPNHTHAAILSDLLNTDLPILCEKPLGTTPAACADILNQAKARIAPVWVAMEYRYMPAVAALLDEVRDGTPGPVKMVSIREHRYPFLEKIGDWNRFNDNTGGTLVEKCCHHFDLMRLILGSDPVRVFASGGIDVNHLGERYGGRTPDIIDNAYVIVDFANGARGMLDLCMFAEGAAFQEIISVVGADARVEARIPGPPRFSGDGHEAEVAVADRHARTETVRSAPVDPALAAAGDHHGSTYYQHQKFSHMVRNGGAPEVSLRDGAIAVLVGAAAEESVRTGAVVPVDIRILD